MEQQHFDYTPSDNLNKNSTINEVGGSSTASQENAISPATAAVEPTPLLPKGSIGIQHIIGYQIDSRDRASELRILLNLITKPSPENE